MAEKQLTTRKRKCESELNNEREKQRIFQLFRVSALIGRVQTLALIDTGSQASILSAYFLSQIPKSELRHENTNRSTFRSACGMPMETIGTFEINVSLHRNDKENIKQIFHAIPNLTEACILGIDFITNNKIKIDSHTRQISYTNNNDEYRVIGKIDTLDTKEVPILTKQQETSLNIENNENRLYSTIIEQLIKSNKDIIAEKTAVRQSNWNQIQN